MAKFMLIYHGPAEPPATPPSPEEYQAVLARWGEWMKKFPGAILDGGDGLKPDGRVIRPGGIVSDGPYAESKEIITGFSLVQADDLAGALVMARETPINLSGMTVEVRELAGYS